jgi:hypothetical protein
VNDYWDFLAGVLLIIIGAYNVWLSRSPRYEDNPFTAWISRWLGGGRARALTLIIGMLCVLLGVVGVVFAMI